MGFVTFCGKGTFSGYESEEIAHSVAERNTGKYLPLPAGFRASVGAVFDGSGTRIIGELPYEKPPKGVRDGVVDWNGEITGNITQYPALMALAKELLADQG